MKLLKTFLSAMMSLMILFSFMVSAEVLVFSSAPEISAEIRGIIAECDEELLSRAGFVRTSELHIWHGEYPSASYSYNMHQGKIVNEQIKLPWGFKRQDVVHEYGHSVASALAGYDPGKLPEYEGRMHWYSLETSPGFALWEGWAEFFSAWVYDDAMMIKPQRTDVPNLETNSWGASSSVEGAVASRLWDYVDSVDSLDHTLGYDDDKLSGYDAALFEAMKTGPRSIEDIERAIGVAFFRTQSVMPVVLSRLKKP